MSAINKKSKNQDLLDIQRLLTDHYSPSLLKITDNTEAHMGHAAMKDKPAMHLQIEIHSSTFNSMSLVERERSVTQCLKDYFESQKIHALTLKTHPI